MNRKVFVTVLSLVALATVVVGTGVAPAVYAAVRTFTIASGDTATVQGSNASVCVRVDEAASTPQKLAVRSYPCPTPTATPRPSATATRTPTATSVPPTHVHPSASASAAPSASAPSGQPAPVAGQQCPAAYHAAITTAGPDGKQYPTWHPPVDEASGCWFGHEHGSDPRTSKADSSMPAFGYVALLHGMAEPHVGFKVYVVNTTDRLPDGKPIFGSIRYVVHHGTGGIGRYRERMHSFEYDAVFRDGRKAHIHVMADTGPTIASVCDSPRSDRTVATTDCPDPYEIWNFVADIGPRPEAASEQYRLRIAGSSAVFDPVLAADKTNLSRVVYNQATKDNPAHIPQSVDPLSAGAWYRGCKREAYFGHGRWWNAGYPSVIYTDPTGRALRQAGDADAVRQELSSVTYINDDLFNWTREHCHATTRAPN